MPILEFYCPENHTAYQFLARGFVPPDVKPRCPDNPSYRMERMLSSFSVTGVTQKSQGQSVDGLEGASDKMLAELAKLEHEMQGLDDEHPDPRSLAKLMRRMGDITGGKLPDPLKEIVARLEAGDDPEALEAEYGTMLESMDLDDATDTEAEAPEIRKRAATIRRDPKLYDLRDYLP